MASFQTVLHNESMFKIVRRAQLYVLDRHSLSILQNGLKLCCGLSSLSEDALEEFVGTSHFSRERLEAALVSDFPACFAEFLLCLTSPRTGGDIAPKQAHCKSTDLRMTIR